MPTSSMERPIAEQAAQSMGMASGPIPQPAATFDCFPQQNSSEPVELHPHSEGLASPLDVWEARVRELVLVYAT
jgi:hypothetical protein